MTLSPANLSVSIDPPTWWSNLVFTRHPVGRNKCCLFKDELRRITKAQNIRTVQNCEFHKAVLGDSRSMFL